MVFSRELMDDVEEIFENDYGGHDFFHTLRVMRIAKYIAKIEGANTEIVELASLLHDVDDYKITGRNMDSVENACKLMNKYNIDKQVQLQVTDIIKTVSFKANDTEIPSSLEGQVVQDADRLDALGAIGIARAFAYGGSRGNMIYNPNSKPNLNMNSDEYVKNKTTTINHFYEKLLLLKDMMNTETGYNIAIKRDQFMRDFLEEFYREWNNI
ncbi:HD domain-containing protein [Methanosphaera sp. Vir-13MRS]|uniref:HD domain-containing protein n=1 Tax=Candidatus Methanosphaera massiliense TaxID=3017187 RepID=UPI002380887E|nr:HD domain-containing protein [Candidatus Methanosphaera massiliense]MDE4079027.1 HD domain-containing protein [Candidatus Methanosphaera massiliense]